MITTELLIDNSALSTLACKRRFQLTVIEGIDANSSNPIIRFGSAFHTVVEHLNKSPDLAAAMKIGQEKYPDIDHSKLLMTTHLFVASTKLPPPITLSDGTPAVEVKFKFHYGDFLTTQGQALRIYLAGTIDRIYYDPKADRLVILDYKTSPIATDSGIQTKKQDYELSFQLPFYTFALSKCGILPAEWQRYIVERKYRTEISLVFYEARPPKFVTVARGAFNDDFLFREVPFIINQHIRDIVAIAELGKAPAPHDGMTVYNACKYCSYRPGCLHMGTYQEEEFLSRFGKRIYNPLAFRD